MIYLLFLLFSLMNPGPASADVYKYINEQGIVSFTDDLAKVPEAQRLNVEKAQSALSSFSSAPISFASDESRFGRWISHPLSKYIAAFAALAILMLYVQSRTKNLLLRLAVKLLFVGFLGAAIYSVIVSQSLPTPSGTSIESFIPNTAAIQKVQKQVKEIEENQRKEEALIHSLLPSEENR